MLTHTFHYVFYNVAADRETRVLSAVFKIYFKQEKFPHDKIIESVT